MRASVRENWREKGKSAGFLLSDIKYEDLSSDFTFYPLVTVNVYVINNATRFKYILSFHRLMLGMQLLFGRVRPYVDITYAKYGRGKLASIYRVIQLTFYVLSPADECNLNSMFLFKAVNETYVDHSMVAFQRVLLYGYFISGLSAENIYFKHIFHKLCILFFYFLHFILNSSVKSI